MDVIIGTAGHIDHGKTALVKALTGIDADRLPEEKRRGITVDLGFAEMSIGDAHFAFVDVPGHERFVKNMLAGASGIDLVMLVIAASEGVMPQTREHFDICRLLGVRSGIVVLTKTDLVDEEALELAKLDAGELVADSFLDGAPMICVSARSGDGMDLLKNTLVQASGDLHRRHDELITRLPIDRSFSIKGFGAVVTGTLASGEIAEGSEMQLLASGAQVRVRGVQTHGRAVPSATAGKRVAVNLGGIDHSKVTRGMVLTEPNVLQTTQIFDAEIEVLPDATKPLRSRQRVRVHVGTIEALARVQVLNNVGEIAAGDKDLAQIRLETPVVAVSGERFIVRRYSPQLTIAGGQVIDAFAGKHHRKDLEAVRGYLYARVAASGDNALTLRLILAAAGPSGLNFNDLQARTSLKNDVLTEAINTNIAAGAVVNAGRHYLVSSAFEALSQSAQSAIERFHRQEPLAKGMSREALRERVFGYLPDEVFQSVVGSLELSGTVKLDGDAVRLTSHHADLSPAEMSFRDKISGIFTTAQLAVPKLEDALAEAITGSNLPASDARKILQMLLDSGGLIKVTDEFYFATNAIDRLREQLKQFASRSPDRLIDVPTFKEIAGISRKYAIPLLEYLDREHVTSRVGDKRLIL